VSVALAGLAMGFLGSAHCIGMCGGIAAALSAASPGSTGTQVRRSLAYNAGRIASYTLIGALAGLFGATLAGLAGNTGMLVLRSLAALFIVAVGLYLAGWSRLVGRIESAGGAVWRRIAPLARRVRVSSSPLAAFGFGALWGWLPCGLLYSALTIAAASGSWTDGALSMAAFGLGTLPATLSIGAFAGRGASLLRSHAARAACGVLVIGFGAWTMVGAVTAARTTAASGSCHSEAAPLESPD
jgi:sulfite exporter TauE/SafE